MVLCYIIDPESSRCFFAHCRHPDTGFRAQSRRIHSGIARKNRRAASDFCGVCGRMRMAGRGGALAAVWRIGGRGPERRWARRGSRPYCHSKCLARRRARYIGHSRTGDAYFAGIRWPGPAKTKAVRRGTGHRLPERLFTDQWPRRTATGALDVLPRLSIPAALPDGRLENKAPALGLAGDD